MISRRDLIKAALATCAGGALVNRAFRAEADAGAPTRFVVFHDNVGITARMGNPRAPGQPDWSDESATLPTASSWELGPAMTPLAAYKDRMIPLVGLSMRSAGVTQATANGGGHGHLWTNALTASPRIYHNRPGGGSIDQIIADGLTAQGVLTPLHSLQVGITSRTASRPVFRPDGTNLPPVWQPPDVYDTIIPPILRRSTDERARLGQRWAEAHRLSTNLSGVRVDMLTGDQRRRFEQHQALRMSHQERLIALLNVDAIFPDRETLLGPWSTAGRYNSAPNNIDAATAWQMTESINTELVALALQLDLTRVAVVSNGTLPSAHWRPGGGEPFRQSLFGRDWHAFHHDAVKPDMLLGAPGESYMLEYHRRKNESLRMLLDNLSSKDDSDGNKVFDNTLVLVSSEMASAAHDYRTLRWSLIIGRCAAERMGIETGAPVFLDRENSDGRLPFEEWIRTRNHRGHSTAQLFTTLAQAFNVESAIGPEAFRPTPLDLEDPMLSELPAREV